MIWPAPNFCRRSFASRHTVDSSFCAGTVASQDSDGVRHVSQLPQAVPVCPKYASSRTRRHSTVSHSASMASRCMPSERRCASSPSEPSMSLRCWTTSCRP